MEEQYAIGVDISTKGDIPCVVIARNLNGNRVITNMLFGDDAIEFYNKYGSDLYIKEIGI